MHVPWEGVAAAAGNVILPRAAASDARRSYSADRDATEPESSVRCVLRNPPPPAPASHCHGRMCVPLSAPGAVARALVLLVLVVGARAQLPNRTATWVMNQSTIIMPCNNSGFTDPETTKGWSVIDFDWSNVRSLTLVVSRLTRPFQLPALRAAGLFACLGVCWSDGPPRAPAHRPPTAGSRPW